MNASTYQFLILDCDADISLKARIRTLGERIRRPEIREVLEKYIPKHILDVTADTSDAVAACKSGDGRCIAWEVVKGITSLNLK